MQLPEATDSDRGIMIPDTTPSDSAGDAICYVNGKRITLPPGRGEATLLQFLRGTQITTLMPRLLSPDMLFEQLDQI